MSSKRASKAKKKDILDLLSFGVTKRESDAPARSLRRKTPFAGRRGKASLVYHNGKGGSPQQKLRVGWAGEHMSGIGLKGSD